MSESLFTMLIFLLLLAVVAVPYWRSTIRKRRDAVRKHTAARSAGLHEPATLHPRIDLLQCIGCGSCVKACPEDVLGIVEGRAAIINGAQCVGHALCAEACPVGGIVMGFGKPRQGMEIPLYDENMLTNVPGLYIAGELSGLGLIRNASSQGVRAVRHIAEHRPRQSGSTLDVAIIGAGPAGIAAALSAVESGLRYMVFEQGTLGGSVLHYPRQKLVLAHPVSFPLYGPLKKSELSKEELLATFTAMVERYQLTICTNTRVEGITSEENAFRIRTNQGEHRAGSVILAMGRRGSPRKLGVAGEELPKVAYQLIEAESYTGKRILVVGGGDSAVEAAVGLSRQKGNSVTISYRREAFVRLKGKNEKNIQEAMRAGAVRVLFESEVTAIRPAEVAFRVKEGPEQTLDNDFVFIFAGGEMPSAFLKAAGVAMRTDETSPASL